jgi:hypothetical protein
MLASSALGAGASSFGGAALLRDRRLARRRPN